MEYIAEIIVRGGEAERIYKALATEKAEKERFKVEIENGGDSLSIRIHAKDATALKAIFNSFVRYLEAFEKIEKFP